MLRRELFAATAVLTLLPAVVSWPQDDREVETKMQRQARSLPAIRNAILSATSYDEASIELTPGPRRLIVAVVNSKLSDGSETGRVDEAVTIASAVAQAIAANPDFADVETLHVDYIRRSTDGAEVQRIDAIPFDRDPKGKFVRRRS
jgi:hypothetical protein